MLYELTRSAIFLYPSRLLFKFDCVLMIHCVLNNNTFQLFLIEHIVDSHFDCWLSLPTVLGGIPPWVKTGVPGVKPL